MGKELLYRYLDRFAKHTGTKPDFDTSFLRYGQQIVRALLM